MGVMDFLLFAVLVASLGMNGYLMLRLIEQWAIIESRRIHTSPRQRPTFVNTNPPHMDAQEDARVAAQTMDALMCYDS